jgi:glycosyltransferase involved in cell wall biosynthesis
VVTIHDVSFLRMPETTEPRTCAICARHIRRTVERADLVLTICAAMADDIRELLACRRRKLRAIPLGLSPNFRRPPGEDAIQAARERLRLERPYLLMVSTLEPRKNYEFLIEVFERLQGFDGDLVLAGMRGWKYQPILDRLHASPLAARIRHLDYVDESLLPGLYGGAELFVFPTLYEGFGFPPLEAMACGTPVVSSAASSLPEVLGTAAMLVDDYDADHWAGVIARVLASPTERAELRARGLERAAGFTWKETARRTWAVYRELAGEPSSDSSPRANGGLP